MQALSHFCKSAPPTETEFRGIARRICDSLNPSSGLMFTCEESSVEPDSWVTTIVRATSDLTPIGRLDVYGIVSFVLGEVEPQAGATLLLFMNAKRITQGEMTVLEAEYDVKTQVWRPFAWMRDIYGEWEGEDCPI